MGEWISVDVQLPKTLTLVLVYAEWSNFNVVMKWPEKGMAIGYYMDGKWRINGKLDVKVTHWMDLPNIPMDV